MNDATAEVPAAIRPEDRLDTLDALNAHYGTPSPNSLVKELDHVSPAYRAFVENAPFVALATSGPEGLDCSPRGDPPGFVHVEHARRLLMPDRPGNNRIDSLRNIVRDPRVALLFLVPGAGETLRVNGRASILRSPELLERFAIRGKLPRAVIAIDVEHVYFQCQKALKRSRLWEPEAQVQPGVLPTAGEMIKAVDADFDAATYDRAYPQRLKSTMY